MKSRSRSHTPIDVDTDPLSFYQMRDQLDGIKQANSNYEENKSSCTWSHSSTQSFEEKSEESPDSKPKSRHAEIQKLWATYFKNNRNEQDLNKDFPALILKKKTVYNNFEKLRTKGIIIRKIESGRKSLLTNDLEIKISQILSDDRDLDVSEIKDELCEQGIEVNQRTQTRYLKKKINYEHKLPINDMMNLTADHMNARLKLRQSYKNQNWIWSFLVLKLYLVILEKVKRSGYRKSQFTELQKLAKESIRSMHGQQYQEQKKPSLNYLLITWILMFI